MKKLYILVSESSTGTHLSEGNEAEEVHTIVLTFPPKVETSPFHPKFKTNLSKNESFREIVSLFQKESKKREVVILVGHDRDSTGELMATALRDNLVRENIPIKKIRRTPLTYEGYIAVKEFTELTVYFKYLYLQEKLMEALRKAGVKRAVGFTKALALKFTIEKRGESFNVSADPKVNLKGISTATTITKSITSEA